MNEYNYYEKICSLERIAAYYGVGKEHCKKLHGMAADIAEKKYRVAFIGEFNRGKSSLINALLAADVLPMDALPMTATVIRIVFGTEKRATIFFKDGRTRNVTLEELVDFATEQDAQKAAMAGSIEEVVVRFPSALLSSHIEILDTPGMNENETVSERTLSVLGKIDAAVVVISAQMPVSLSEQNLILDMIVRPEIQHLIFAVTFIDRLETDKERAHILKFISCRLKTEVLELARKNFEGDVKFLAKARRILSQPDVFGVSALQARTALKKDSAELLKRSGLMRFKENLTQILTKAQVEDIPIKTLQAVEWLLKKLPEWRRAEEIALSRGSQPKDCAAYSEKMRQELVSWLRGMDINLDTKGLSGLSNGSSEIILRKTFISRLARISSANNNHATIFRLMEEASAEAVQIMAERGEVLKNWSALSMSTIEKKFITARKKNSMPCGDFQAALNNFHRQTVFPKFFWTKAPIPTGVNLKGLDIMPRISEAIHDSVKDFNRRINDYIGAWRLLFFSQLKSDRENPTAPANSGNAAIKKKLAALPFLYEQHIIFLENLRKELQGISAQDGG